MEAWKDSERNDDKIDLQTYADGMHGNELKTETMEMWRQFSEYKKKNLGHNTT